MSRPSSRPSRAYGSMRPGSRQSIQPASSTSSSAASVAVQSQQQHLQYNENGQVILTPAQQRVRDKQREWEGFVKLCRQTEQFNSTMREMANKTELLEEGTQGTCACLS